MSKQDRQGVRTAVDLERKYNFDKRFAELLGIATDARESVDSLASELRDEITDQATELTRSAEEIAMKAISETTYAGDIEKLNKDVSELKVTADGIKFDFESSKSRVEEVDGDVKKITEDLSKHFDFGVNGLTIRAGDSQIKLRIDNDVISFYKGDIDESDLAKNRLGWWDGDSFHTGNIYVDVDEVAQFGNYGFVPYEDEDTDGLDLVRVGG